jgi:hypothetical protein
MKITKYEDVFELLTDERLAVIEDMNTEDLKETISTFAFLATMLGENEVIKQVCPMVNDVEDKLFLKSTFKKGLAGANVMLEKFEDLTNS